MHLIFTEVVERESLNITFVQKDACMLPLVNRKPEYFETLVCDSTIVLQNFSEIKSIEFS